MKSHNALVKHLKLMQNHEDFELKKLLFNIMVTLGKDSTALPVSIFFIRKKVIPEYKGKKRYYNVSGDG